MKQVTDLHQILGHEDVTSRGIVPVYWSASQLLSKLDKPIRSQYGGSVTNERHGTRDHSQPIRSKHRGTVIKERLESGSAVSYNHSQPIRSQYSGSVTNERLEKRNYYQAQYGDNRYFI